MAQITPQKLAELLAKAKANRLANELSGGIKNSGVAESNTPYDKSNVSEAVASITPNTPAIPTTTVDNSNNISSISYNKEQQDFISLATRGESCVLVGAAGTGKTTCMKGTTLSLIQSGIAGIYNDDGHKVLKHGTAGIVVCAFTRRAVANIRKNMPNDLKSNCLTIHALLEYEPIRDEILDEESGLTKTVMQFVPTRTASRPLDSSIRTIIVEESSMVAGTPYEKDNFLLFNQLREACPHNPQFIFLGDIQQLPPVFGAAILGYKMLELPVIELTQVYRQALESPIIKLAHRILSGVPIPHTEFPEINESAKGMLTLHNWKKKISADDALATIGAFFTRAIDSKLLSTDEDIILIPFNKACGTLELNKIIANHLARKSNAVTYEIIAGYNKYYFSVGDKILVDKEDAIITRIVPNVTYSGKNYQKESTTLDYWGHNMAGRTTASIEMSDADIDKLIELASSDSEERTTKASHTIWYKRYGSEVELKVDTASEINNILLGYALTVHKSQGSEWRKVFCVFHQSHATMIQRELLYTAITRAKEELYVICENETFVNGIKSQRIKGNTIAEKAEFFKGKVELETGGN